MEMCRRNIEQGSKISGISRLGISAVGSPRSSECAGDPAELGAARHRRLSTRAVRATGYICLDIISEV